MRIFRYWAFAEGTHRIQDKTVALRCRGGSNDSPEAAQLDGERRLAKAKARIEGRIPADDSYESDITEEPLTVLNPQNIITRNRYGAQVLNSTSHVFIDIDQPRYGFLDLFRSRSLEKRKERILKQVEARAQEAALQNATLRAYETHKGIRLLLQGLSLDPRTPACRQLLRSFHADGLYTDLCRKQGCYRARLTPKPYRMHSPTIRLTYPRPPELEVQYQHWLPEYEGRSEAFATCRHRFTWGSHPIDAVVELHDALTRAHCQDLRLA